MRSRAISYANRHTSPRKGEDHDIFAVLVVTELPGKQLSCFAAVAELLKFVHVERASPPDSVQRMYRPARARFGSTRQRSRDLTAASPPRPVSRCAQSGRAEAA